MSWIDLAAEVPASPPSAPLLKKDDYPPGALSRGEEGQVVAELLIDPSGRVQNCTILMSSSFAALDEATCRIFRTRAKFTPAMTVNHVPTYSFFRAGPISWSLGTFQRRRKLEPDYELTINRAPDGYAMPIEFNIEFTTTTTGAIRGCKLAKDQRAPVELAELACQTAGKLPIRVARNSSGIAVDARDGATVRFILDKR